MKSIITTKLLLSINTSSRAVTQVDDFSPLKTYYTPVSVLCDTSIAGVMMYPKLKLLLNAAAPSRGLAQAKKLSTIISSSVELNLPTVPPHSLSPCSDNTIKLSISSHLSNQPTVPYTNDRAIRNKRTTPLSDHHDQALQ